MASILGGHLVQSSPKSGAPLSTVDGGLHTLLRVWVADRGGFVARRRVECGGQVPPEVGAITCERRCWRRGSWRL